jgi:hypothetical protein
MKSDFGKIYGGNNPTHGVYTANNLHIWGDRAVAISHHWTADAANEAAAKETASRHESCVVVAYEN